MQLDAYLNRIGYHGARKVDVDTLIALHRAQLRTIPYENLDIALGRTLSLDEASIYAKLVTARRGGWCYEVSYPAAKAEGIRQSPSDVALPWAHFGVLSRGPSPARQFGQLTVALRATSWAANTSA
jgi:hypothetical protein